MDETNLAPGDIYNIENRYQNALKNFMKANVRPRNREFVLSFVRDLKLQGRTRSRQLFYVLRFSNLGPVCDKDFDQMDKEDIKKLVEWIQDKQEWANNTKADHKLCIKRFYKWLEGEDEEYPRKVSWIRPKYDGPKKLAQQDLVSEDELHLLLKHTRNTQERAMLWVLWEGGLRIGELLHMQVKDLTFDSMGALIHVPDEGKTGARPVRLVAAVPALSAHYDDHPTANLEDALWLNANGRPLKYGPAVHLLARIKRRACITKKLNFHLFRKSAATRVAPHLREAVMKNYFGWTQSSRMPAVYVHMSGAAVDEEVLKMYGKIPKEENRTSKLKPKECNICGTANTIDRDWCIRCRHPISEKAKMEADRKMLKPEMEEFVVKILHKPENLAALKKMLSASATANQVQTP